MRLGEYVERENLRRKRGRGELARLQRVTGISYTTLHQLARDEHVATYPVARLISLATSGTVSIAELCELPPPPRPKRSSVAPTAAAKRAAKRKRSRRAPSSVAVPAAAARG